MPTLTNYTRAQLIEEVIDRFKPRDLILNRPEVQTLPSCMNQTMQKLNDFVYLGRYYELPISNGSVDLTAVTIPGISVKRVNMIYSNKQFETIFTTYSQVLGQTPFYFNIIRNQDMFLDFLMTKTVQDQLNRKFKNKDTGWIQAGNKLLLDPQVWSNYASVTILFYPQFIENSEAWELYDIEVNFIRNYLEAVVMYREGRAMSELGFTDLNTNADKYVEDGKTKMEEIITKFTSSARLQIGYRF